jgi:hypothetical protein
MRWKWVSEFPGVAKSFGVEPKELWKLMLTSILSHEFGHNLDALLGTIFKKEGSELVDAPYCSNRKDQENIVELKKGLSKCVEKKGLDLSTNQKNELIEVATSKALSEAKKNLFRAAELEKALNKVEESRLSEKEKTLLIQDVMKKASTKGENYKLSESEQKEIIEDVKNNIPWKPDIVNDEIFADYISYIVIYDILVKKGYNGENLGHLVTKSLPLAVLVLSKTDDSFDLFSFIHPPNYLRFDSTLGLINKFYDDKLGLNLQPESLAYSIKEDRFEF